MEFLTEKCHMCGKIKDDCYVSYIHTNLKARKAYSCKECYDNLMFRAFGDEYDPIKEWEEVKL